MFIDLIEKSKIPDAVIHIAGPPRSGKTTFFYHLCKGIKKDEKAIIIDCEMNFSAQRLHEIISDETKIDLDNILLIRAAGSYDQFHSIMNIHSFLEGINCKFIGINGITDHFRLGFIDQNNHYYHSLAIQIAYLKMINLKYNIPILFTNQVSVTRVGGKEILTPIASNILRFYSDILITTREIRRNLWKIVVNGKHNEYSISSTEIKIIK